MCGRYATTRSSVDLSALFEATDDVEGLEPDYNVAPTDPVPVVRMSAGGRRLSTARWGLVPHWAKDPRAGARMQAYYMTPADGRICAFAGIWAVWGPDKLLTCSVVTIPAIDDLTLIHDRMPLLLPPERWTAWLDGPPGDELLAPTPGDLVAELELRPVGAAVGDVRNDGPELIARVNAPPLGGMPDSPVDLTLF